MDLARRALGERRNDPRIPSSCSQSITQNGNKIYSIPDNSDPSRASTRAGQELRLEPGVKVDEPGTSDNISTPTVTTSFISTPSSPAHRESVFVYRHPERRRHLDLVSAGFRSPIAGRHRVVSCRQLRARRIYFSAATTRNARSPRTRDEGAAWRAPTASRSSTARTATRRALCRRTTALIYPDRDTISLHGRTSEVTTDGQARRRASVVCGRGASSARSACATRRPGRCTFTRPVADRTWRVARPDGGGARRRRDGPTRPCRSVARARRRVPIHLGWRRLQTARPTTSRRPLTDRFEPTPRPSRTRPTTEGAAWLLTAEALTTPRGPPHIATAVLGLLGRMRRADWRRDPRFLGHAQMLLDSRSVPPLRSDSASCSSVSPTSISAGSHARPSARRRDAPSPSPRAEEILLFSADGRRGGSTGDHEALKAAIAEVSGALRSGGSSEDATAVLRRLRRHPVDHFDREEALAMPFLLAGVSGRSSSPRRGTCRCPRRRRDGRDRRAHIDRAVNAFDVQVTSLAVSAASQR